MAPLFGNAPKFVHWEWTDLLLIYRGIKWRRTYGLLPLMLTLVRTSCTNEFSLCTQMARQQELEPWKSDLESNILPLKLLTYKLFVLKKMSEKDSNLHEVASSSSRGLIGVEPKRHWSTLRWCLNLSPYSSITQIGPYWKSRTYVATTDKWFTVIPRPLRD